MRGFRLIWMCAALLMLSGCSKRPEQEAALEAQRYYSYLAEGDAVRFLQGKAGINQQDAAYSEQLLLAVRQHQDEIKEKHGGLRQVQVSNNTNPVIDTIQSVVSVDAFLLLCYGDSTQEEIVVPMVLTAEGRWQMK